LPHTQLYSGCARLAEAGLLSEKREESGRRRRIYRLTKAGKAALDRWRTEPTSELYELRDAGLLKLFFGADPARLAADQLEAHEGRLREYEAQLEECRRMKAPPGIMHAIEAGIGHEREYVRFWSKLRS
jgi:PadR family transcriptional regulator AphA